MSEQQRRIECKFQWNPTIKPEDQKKREFLEASVQRQIEDRGKHCERGSVVSVNFQGPGANLFGEAFAGVVVCSCRTTIAAFNVTPDGEVHFTDYRG